MSPITAGTAIGAAALTVGRGALDAVGNGLSFAAELLKAGSGANSNTPRAADSSAQARAVLQSRIDELQQRIEQHLAAAGVHLIEPVELISNGQGGIAVAGPHPQQAALEEILGSDILLERDFHLLATDYGEVAESIHAADMPPNLTIVIPK